MDQLVDRHHKIRVVLSGIGSNLVQNSTVAVGSLPVVAFGLVDHAESLPAVMGAREALDDVERVLLGFVKPALLDVVGGAAGIEPEFFLDVVEVVSCGAPGSGIRRGISP